MTLRQRQPREEDPAWLAAVRKMPCLICGRGPCDPAHIRAPAPHYGKRNTGFGEKPDDKWVLPLCRRHHEAQHRESELGWWLSMGFPDPFAVAQALYAKRPTLVRAERPRKPTKRRSKFKSGRKLQTGKRLEGRSTFPTGRKLSTRKAGAK